MISKKGTGWPVANAYSAVVVVGRNESITRGDEVVGQYGCGTSHKYRLNLTSPVRPIVKDTRRRVNSI
jgi:hypothetical protein